MLFVFSMRIFHFYMLCLGLAFVDVLTYLDLTFINANLDVRWFILSNLLRERVALVQQLELLKCD